MRTYALKKYLNPHENINITYLDHDRMCETHTHEFVELIFIAEGWCEQCIDGERYDAEAGDLIFVNYGQTHSFLAKSKEFRYYNLLYVPAFFSEELINSENIYEIFEISLFQEFSEMKADRSQIVHFRGNEYLEIKKMIEEMRREFVRKELGYRSVLNGYSRVLYSRILRELKSAQVYAGSQSCIGRITAECLAYIDSRCFEKLTLKEIAEHTFYNPAYLSRIFKEQCGISLSEYIKEKRMEEAARLLVQSELNNDEIMYKVGYTDKKQFYKNFRDIYHETPAEFRKRYPTAK